MSCVVLKDGTEPKVSVRIRRAGTSCVSPPGELTLGHGTGREPASYTDCKGMQTVTNAEGTVFVHMVDGGLRAGEACGAVP